MKRFTAVMLAFLIGCGAPPQPPDTPPNAPGARIDLARALARHPFAAVLAQYDIDIATLERAAGKRPFADFHARLEAGGAENDRRLRAAAVRTRAMRFQPIQLPANDAARPDFSTAETGSFQHAAQARVERAVALRASQLREREATVAFDFERAHAGQRLVLELKLRDLHLDSQTRRRYRAQLDALQRRENALVQAEREGDDGTLAAYRAELRARAVADSAALTSDLASHARAMRELPKPQVRPLAGSTLFQSNDGAPDGAAFDAARRDLTAYRLDVRATDDSARGDAGTEIVNLERERDALRAQIIASIEARAAGIAAQRHLGRLYTTAAPAGARDVTGDVLRSYWVSTGS
jgi:hypothetical protein